jgi:hypothetical protein
MATFSGGDSAQDKQDIPGQVARWLFRIGTVWAVLLIPITTLVCAITPFALVVCLTGHHSFGRPEQWLICPYLISGYAIWIGWGWRSRKPRNLMMCALFWLVSAGFNVMQPVHIWMDSHSLWTLLYPPPLWGSLATVGSLVALSFEFGMSRR